MVEIHSNVILKPTFDSMSEYLNAIIKRLFKVQTNCFLVVVELGKIDLDLSDDIFDYCKLLRHSEVFNKGRIICIWNEKIKEAITISALIGRDFIELIPEKIIETVIRKILKK